MTTTQDTTTFDSTNVIEIDVGWCYPTVHAVIVTITPEFARELLTHNTKNRHLKPRKIEAWVRDIQAGNWTMNGETIKIAADGTLLDGQNRLTAVVAADHPIDSMIVYGLDNQTQDTVDQGVKRSTADTLAINGYANVTALSAAVALLLKMENGRNMAPTASEAEDYIVNHPDVVEWTKRGVDLRKGIPELRAAPMIAALTLFARLDVADANRFFDGMANNVTSGVGDPRNTLLRSLRNGRAQRKVNESFDQLNLLIRVWNAWRTGKSLTKLPYSDKINKPV